MDNLKTIRLLIETSLAVIACENGKLLQDFLEYVSTEHGKPIAECDVDEVDKANLTSGEVVIVRGIRNGHGGEKLQVAQRLTELKNIAEACNAHFIVPLEKLDCAPHLINAQLRGIWLRISEGDQSEINMFRLYCISKPNSNSDDFKLECEIGAIAGKYLLYYHCKQGFQLKDEI